jgi:hypothetical protein
MLPKRRAASIHLACFIAILFDELLPIKLEKGEILYGGMLKFKRRKVNESKRLVFHTRFCNFVVS